MMSCLLVLSPGREVLRRVDSGKTGFFNHIQGAPRTKRRWAETLWKPDWIELVAQVSKSALAGATVAGGFGPALLKFVECRRSINC